MGKLLSPNELTEMRQRFADDFYHMSHKSVVAHVGLLLDHIDANQEVIEVAETVNAIINREIDGDVFSELYVACIQLREAFSKRNIHASAASGTPGRGDGEGGE